MAICVKYFIRMSLGQARSATWWARGKFNLPPCLVSDSKGNEVAIFKNWDISQESVSSASHEKYGSPATLLSYSVWQKLAGIEEQLPF